MLNGPLGSKSKEIKTSYVLIWGWKSRKNRHKVFKSFSRAEVDPKILLQKFLDRTKPNSNVLAAAAAANFCSWKKVI